MKQLLIVILLLIPHCGYSQTIPEGILHGVIGAYGVAAFTDTSLTEYGLGKGIVHEANPLQKWATDKGPVWAGISKGTEHVLLGYLLLKFHNSGDDKTKKIILATAIGLTAFQTWVDYSNAKVISKSGIR